MRFVPIIFALFLAGCEKTPNHYLLYCEGFNRYMNDNATAYFRVDLKSNVIVASTDLEYEYKITKINDQQIVARGGFQDESSPAVKLDRRTLKLVWTASKYSISYDCQFATDKQL